MNDTKIILNLINISIPDSHPALYQYITGGEKSKESAINRIYNLFEGVITPPYSSKQVRGVVKCFLEVKNEMYSRGEIKITPIY
tara:strand:+ start:2211 stop:2462 length:252 start_codon:yes stop_codon:yes gene_type:complete